MCFSKQIQLHVYMFGEFGQLEDMCGQIPSASGARHFVRYFMFSHDPDKEQEYIFGGCHFY